MKQAVLIATSEKDKEGIEDVKLDDSNLLRIYLFESQMAFLPFIESKIQFIKERLQNSWAKKRWNKITIIGELFNELKKIESKINSIKNGNALKRDVVDIINISEIIKELEKIEHRIPKITKVVEIITTNTENILQNPKKEEISKKIKKQEIIISEEDRNNKKEEELIMKISKILSAFENLHKKYFEEKKSTKPNPKKLKEIQNKVSEIVENFRETIILNDIISDNFDRLLFNVIRVSNEILQDDGIVFNSENIENQYSEKNLLKNEIEEIKLDEKYENFFDKFFLKINYKISNTANPKNSWSYSVGDGAFVLNIFRPIMRNIKNLMENWKINPKNTSWQKIILEYEKNTETNDIIAQNLLKILEKNSSEWDFIEIFKYLKDAIKDLSEKNFYVKTKDIKPLSSTIKILEDFIKEFVS